MSPYGWYQLARVQHELGRIDETQKVLDHLAKFEPKVARQLERETGLRRKYIVMTRRRPGRRSSDRRGAAGAERPRRPGLLRVGKAGYTPGNSTPATGAPAKKTSIARRSCSGDSRLSMVVRQEEPAMQLTEKQKEYWSKNLASPGSCSSSGSW